MHAKNAGALCRSSWLSPRATRNSCLYSLPRHTANSDTHTQTHTEARLDQVDPSDVSVTSLSQIKRIRPTTPSNVDFYARSPGQGRVGGFVGSILAITHNPYLSALSFCPMVQGRQRMFAMRSFWNCIFWKICSGSWLSPVSSAVKLSSKLLKWSGH